MVLRNYFILRLAQLSWGLDTSSGEFSYSDLKHYCFSSEGSWLWSRGSRREGVPASQPLQLRSWGHSASRASFIFQGRYQLVSCTTRDESVLDPWAEIPRENVEQTAC